MLIDTLKKENLLALKNKDENKRAVLSVIINKYMILGYEYKANNKEIGDTELINIISKTLKELEEERKSFLEFILDILNVIFNKITKKYLLFGIKW